MRLLDWPQKAYKFVVVQLLSHVSLWLHEWWHTRLACPSPSPRACSNSCPLHQWCRPTISSFVAHFSSCPQSFPSGSFPVSGLFAIRWPKHWSFSFSISPSNEYSGFISFRSDYFDLLAVQGTLESSPAPQFESINFSALNLLCGPSLTSIHDCWKNHNFDYMHLCGKVVSLLFNILSRLVMAFLPRSKSLLTL